MPRELELDWLVGLLSNHSQQEVEDLIGTFLLTVGIDARTTHPALLAVVEALAYRAGVEVGDTFEESEAKIAQYLQENPLNPELRISFEQRLAQTIAQSQPSDLMYGFARFAEKDLGKRAFDGKRPEGTRPGFLALLAHKDIK